MGNRDKRDDKSKKPKKAVKQAVGQVQITEVLPPVEVVKKKKREQVADED